MIEIEIKNYLPEGYTLSKGSEVSKIILSDKGIDYKFNYEAEYEKEIEFDPHEDDDILRGKAIEKKMVDGSIYNIEEGSISIKDVWGISKSSKAYFKTKEDESNKLKSYAYEISVGDLILSFETKEEQSEVYSIVLMWFKENK